MCVDDGHPLTRRGVPTHDHEVGTARKHLAVNALAQNRRLEAVHRARMLLRLLHQSDGIRIEESHGAVVEADPHKRRNVREAGGEVLTSALEPTFDGTRFGVED